MSLPCCNFQLGHVVLSVFEASKKNGLQYHNFFSIRINILQMENWGTYVRRQAQIQARRVFCWVLPQAAVFRRKGLIRRVVGSWDSCSAEKKCFPFRYSYQYQYIYSYSYYSYIPISISIIISI